MSAYSDRMQEVDAREERLPKWAQDKLAWFRRELSDVQRQYHELVEGREPGPFFLRDGISDSAFYLPRYSRLIFGPANNYHAQISLSADGNKLAIQGGDVIEVLPEAANFIRVRIAR